MLRVGGGLDRCGVTVARGAAGSGTKGAACCETGLMLLKIRARCQTNLTGARTTTNGITGHQYTTALLASAKFC